MRDLSKLNDQAAQAIAQLARDGIAVSPLEIIQLNWLGWQVQSPSSRMQMARGRPVAVGGVTLWPLTIAAYEWMQTVSAELPARLVPFATAYAMVYGRSDCGEMDLCGGAAVKAVRGFRRALRCTFAELNEAMQQISAQSETDEQPPRKVEHAGGQEMTTGDICAFLKSSCGGTHELWERLCSMSHALGMMRLVIAQAQTEGRAVVGDPSIEAEKALGWAILKIAETHKGAANGEA